MSSQLVVVSTNHRNADVDVRDRYSLTDQQVGRVEALPMQDSSIEVEEAAVLTTCNRTEFYLVTSSAGEMLDRVRDCYRLVKGFEEDPNWSPSSHRNEEAARHLFRVAGGLESQVLGENQILSQVKRVHERLVDSAADHPLLTRLFQEAVRTGKQVRSRTKLCEGAVSVSHAAVELARKVYSKLDKTRVLIIGAGETSSLVLRHLTALGVRKVHVANRTRERAVALAEMHDVAAIGLDEVEGVLEQVDVVFSATSSQEPVLRHAQIEPVVRSRRGGPLVLLDIATPRDIAPEISELFGVFLYNIDNLRVVVDENLDRRRSELPVADEIVEAQIGNFWAWVKTLEVKPTISKLSERFQAIRLQELARLQHKMSPEELETIDQVTRALVKKLLHHPIASLREMSNGERLDRNLIRAVWEMYQLHDSDETGKDEE